MRGRGNRFEVIQKFSDAPVTVCPTCGGAVRRLISSPAIQFKGSGWYITDYARKGNPAATAAPRPRRSRTAITARRAVTPRRAAPRPRHRPIRRRHPRSKGIGRLLVVRVLEIRVVGRLEFVGILFVGLRLRRFRLVLVELTSFS